MSTLDPGNIKERFRTAWRDAFEGVFHHPPVPVTSKRFRQMVARRVKGQIADWHWTLPRRHPWAHRLLDKHPVIDRLVMKYTL